MKKLKINDLQVSSFVTGKDSVLGGGQTKGNCPTNGCGDLSQEYPCYETDICATANGCESELCVPYTG
ncbi:MAG: pinensin family lanthipeptide [Cyclobacteriaceae bacterium]